MFPVDSMETYGSYSIFLNSSRAVIDSIKQAQVVFSRRRSRCVLCSRSRHTHVAERSAAAEVRAFDAACTKSFRPLNLQRYTYQRLPVHHLLSGALSGRLSHLRRTASPLSVCDVAPASMSADLKEAYSIWAQPKGRLGEQLRSEIAHLAGRYGGPAFPPHVTVLGDIERPREEAVALMRELAAQVKKYRINFTEMTRGTFFYQCAFLLVAKDEGTMGAAAAARSVFGRTTPPYMPHLSLLYKDMTDEEKAQVVEYETARLYGDSSGYDTLLVETGYEVGSLALWYTPTEDTSTASWCLVEEFPLS